MTDLAQTQTAPLVTRTLSDITQAFDSPLDPEPRLRRALLLLGGIVPFSHGAICVASGSTRRVITYPENLARNDSLNATLQRLLRSLSTEARSGQNTAATGPTSLVGRTSHLALPLIGEDRVFGLLFVARSPDQPYREEDLRLVSIVAAQIAAYVNASRPDLQMPCERRVARRARFRRDTR